MNTPQYTQSTMPKYTAMIGHGRKANVREVYLPWNTIVFRDEIEISRVRGAAKCSKLPEVYRDPNSHYYEVSDGNHRLCAQMKAGLPSANVLLTTWD